MPNAYQLFAEILDYPGRPISQAIKQCLAILPIECSEAAANLKDFEIASTTMELARLQELYTESFDLKPDCTLNMSYHLFGDDWRRSMFLAELKGIYESNSFQTGNELPDHLCLILRFIALKGPEGQTNDLAQECVVPALRRMISGIRPENNPYKDALQALLIWLRPSDEVSIPFTAEKAPLVTPEEFAE